MVGLRSLIEHYQRFIQEANNLKVNEAIPLVTRERLAIKIAVYASVVKDLKQTMPKKIWSDVPPKKRGRKKKIKTDG